VSSWKFASFGVRQSSGAVRPARHKTEVEKRNDQLCSVMVTRGGKSSSRVEACHGFGDVVMSYGMDPRDDGPLPLTKPKRQRTAALHDATRSRRHL